MNEVAVIEPGAVTLTAGQVKARVQLIQQVMRDVMKEGVHYGVIPGTDKPTLLKPGAEVLCTTFRIAVDPEIEDLSTSDEIRYRIRCVGTAQGDGTKVGSGIGECSSNEEKYKWRKTNAREFAATPEDRRRIKYGYNKGERKEFETQQIRTEPADVANTILKMAKKRALVDFTLTALAASDCFNQDLEDMPEELREEHASQPKTVRQPRAKSEKKDEADGKKLESGQLNFLRKKLDGNAEHEKAVCAKFGVDKLEDIAFGDMNKVVGFIGELTNDAAD